MSDTADQLPLNEDLRAQLLAQPELILADRDLMRALIGAREAELGDNVIDIRGRAMQALEQRLDRLELQHQTVISAAYDNQSGMNTIHRAVLSLLEPVDFPSFLENLEQEIAPILRVDTLSLVIETPPEEQKQALPGPLHMLPAGSLSRIILGGRRAPRGDDIILRRIRPETLDLHGTTHGTIRSEALLPLTLESPYGAAMLLMGSTDADRFSPVQGTDLLRFFRQVFRLALLGWLRK